MGLQVPTNAMARRFRGTARPQVHRGALQPGQPSHPKGCPVGQPGHPRGAAWLKRTGKGQADPCSPQGRHRVSPWVPKYSRTATPISPSQSAGRAGRGGLRGTLCLSQNGIHVHAKLGQTQLTNEVTNKPHPPNQRPPPRMSCTTTSCSARHSTRETRRPTHPTFFEVGHL